MYDEKLNIHVPPRGLKQVWSSCPGQAVFPCRQVTCHVHMSDRQVRRKGICQLNCKKYDKHAMQAKFENYLSGGQAGIH